MWFITYMLPGEIGKGVGKQNRAEATERCVPAGPTEGSFIRVPWGMRTCNVCLRAGQRSWASFPTPSPTSHCFWVAPEGCPGTTVPPAVRANSSHPRAVCPRRSFRSLLLAVKTHQSRGGRGQGQGGNTKGIKRNSRRSTQAHTP